MKTTQQKYQQAIEAVEKAATLISTLERQNKELRQALADVIYTDGKDLIQARLILNKQYNEKPEVFRGYTPSEQKAMKKDIEKEMGAAPESIVDHNKLDAWFHSRDITLKQAITNSPMNHVIKHRWKLCSLKEKQTYFTKYNILNKA